MRTAMLTVRAVRSMRVRAMRVRAMRVRAMLVRAGLSACSPVPRVAAPGRVDTIPCAGEVEGEEGVAVGHVALVGDTIVVAGEAKGAFVIEGQARRCPSSPSILVLGLRRTGAARFAWCVASPAPFPSLAVTRDGFAVAGRMVRDGVAQRPPPCRRPVRWGRPQTPGPASAEEIAVLRFAADGTPRGRVTVSASAGPVAALAALPDGTLVVEGSAPHVPPRPFVGEHFLARVDTQGAVSDLEARREVAQGAPRVEVGAAPGRRAVSRRRGGKRDRGGDPRGQG